MSMRTARFGPVSGYLQVLHLKLVMAAHRAETCSMPFKYNDRVVKMNLVSFFFFKYSSLL